MAIITSRQKDVLIKLFSRIFVVIQCVLYYVNKLRNFVRKKIFKFSIFDISGHKQAINKLPPLILTTRLTALKWDLVSQCYYRNKIKINKKILKTRTRYTNSIFIFATKHIWVEEILLLEVKVRGFTLKVQGMDSLK